MAKRVKGTMVHSGIVFLIYYDFSFKIVYVDFNFSFKILCVDFKDFKIF